MKKIISILGLMIAASAIAPAQYVRPPQPPPAVPPNYTPAYHVPDYSGNNSSFSNNSMQTHAPANQSSGPYTGNGDYTDPTKSSPPPAIYNQNNTGQQLPAPPTPNNTGVPDNTNATIYNR